MKASFMSRQGPFGFADIAWVGVFRSMFGGWLLAGMILIAQLIETVWVAV
jgi:hypothetical protein